MYHEMDSSNEEKFTNEKNTPNEICVLLIIRKFSQFSWGEGCVGEELRKEDKKFSASKIDIHYHHQYDRLMRVSNYPGNLRTNK
ncbi:hypothetical protein T01_8790 [Trichinella spiralis]|uniref:Uncharacterized protein n=1 Tax=Trichinella spiralis TaxID=6334 RepID=A0A0V1BWY3_TRISP|nr:hypothetical protein T01_8790 [Trichinella spiralis]